MVNFWQKYRFNFKASAMVFGLVTLVWIWNLLNFTLGNHDWSYIRYGIPIFSGMWEARITQYFPHYLFFNGQILPIFMGLIAFMCMSGASVLTAYWFELPKKYLQVLLFSLLIALNPYHISNFYYYYLTLSFCCWHLLTIIGLMYAYKFANNQGVIYFVGATICLLMSLLGYVPLVEMILLLSILKFLLEMMNTKILNKSFFIKWFKYGICLSVILVSYALIIVILKKMDLVSLGMYNTQAHSLIEIIKSFPHTLFKPFAVLVHDIPFLRLSFKYLTFGLLILCLVLFFLYEKKRFCYLFILLTAMIYATFFSSYISARDTFFIFRTHTFSFPYLIAFLYAVILKITQKKKCYLLGNITFIVVLVYLSVFIQADITAQKVWYLGNKQDELVLERIKANLFDEIDFKKNYRLTSIGGLYGRVKFAQRYEIHKNIMERDREYYGSPYFMGYNFSSVLFGGELFNPIYGNALWIGYKYFYVTIDETITAEKKVEAEIFSKTFGDDKELMRQKFFLLRSFPYAPFYLVGEKDIIIVLSNDLIEKQRFYENVLK